MKKIIESPIWLTDKAQEAYDQVDPLCITDDGDGKFSLYQSNRPDPSNLIRDNLTKEEVNECLESYLDPLDEDED